MDRDKILAHAEGMVEHYRAQLTDFGAKFAERLAAHDPGYALAWSRPAFEAAGSYEAWRDVAECLRNYADADISVPIGHLLEHATDRAMANPERSTSPLMNMMAEERRVAWVVVRRYLRDVAR